MSEKDGKSAQDEANVCSCLLTLLSLPGPLLTTMRDKRGRIEKGLGIRTVISFVLCCKILGRLAFVQCPRKQFKAVRRMEVMLTGGFAQKRKRLRNKSSKAQTRDRVFLYIENCVKSFITEDFTGLYGYPIDVKELQSEVLEADEFLDDLLSTLGDSPCLSHILPISVLSLVWFLVELLLEGCYMGSDVESEKLAEFRHFDTYSVLEKVSLDILKPFHPGSGALVGGDGRPVFSAASAYGRDGKLARIAISNTALASALWGGARMRVSAKSCSTEEDETNTIGLHSFFPFLLDDVIHSEVEDREFQSTMEEARDFLKDAPLESLVAKRILTTFFRSYEALLRCNRVAVESFRGPGVVGRSKDVPEIVLCRTPESANGSKSIRDVVLKSVDKDMKKFRRTKDSCLDSEREDVGKAGVKTVRCVCSFAKELCQFLFNCVSLAEKIVREAQDANEETKPSDIQSNLFSRLTLGLFARDLSGNISELYEDYVYSWLMRHFDERDGVAKTLVRSGRVRHVSRPAGRGKSLKTKDRELRKDDGTASVTREGA